jgi:hypothetical protein
MKRSLKNLIGYSIEAKDGTKGSIKDFLFDDDSWTIRYAEADLGKILPGKKVLIPRVFLKDPDWNMGHFPVELTKDEVENCPPLEEHMPVSRKYEEKLNAHYGIDNYWPIAHVPPFGSPSLIKPATPVRVPRKVIDEEEIDTHLRSFNEVKGYHLECSDKKRGKIDDFIIDVENWQVVYVIADIGHWYTRSKKIMLAVSWMKEINYTGNVVQIDIHSSVLEQAPEFDPSVPANIEYEKKVYDYYGRKAENA